MSFFSYLPIFTSVYLLIGFLVEVVYWIDYLKQSAEAFIRVREDFLSIGETITDADRRNIFNETDYFRRKVKIRYLGWCTEQFKSWNNSYNHSTEYLDAKIRSAQERFNEALSPPVTPKFSVYNALGSIALWPIDLIKLTCEYSGKIILYSVNVTNAWLTKVSAYVWIYFAKR